MVHIKALNFQRIIALGNVAYKISAEISEEKMSEILANDGKFQVYDYDFVYQIIDHTGVPGVGSRVLIVATRLEK